MSTHVPGQPDPEYLGHDGPATESAEPSRGGRGRRTGLVVVAAVAVLAALGAGGYGLAQLLSGGSSPATAVPADAVGYVSLDLDPSATQKIEAFKIMRRFPGIRKELTGGRDDLRRAAFEQITRGGDCTGLDYAKDVEPWIGDRVALAAVPDSRTGVLPLVVLQVSDRAKAKAGVAALGACDSTQAAPGVAFVGDYLVLTEKQKDADTLAADAGAASLADDPEFVAAMDRTGDPGIVTLYAAQDAPDAFLTASEKSSSFVVGDANPKVEKQFAEVERKQLEQYRRMFKDFQGAAGVIRFHGGAVEAEFTGKGLPATMGGPGAAPGPDLTTLPDTTAAALSVGFKPGWLRSYLEQVSPVLGDGESLDRMLKQGERATGLRLPDDIETMLGRGLVVSVDGKADLAALTESPDPSRVPAGIRITGDPAAITPIIDKLKRAAGPDADIVKVGTGDGVVSVGFDQAYVARLLQHGGLGSVRSFDDVVPHADRVTGALYVNFDAGGDWAARLAERLSDGDPQAKANIAPLDALGISTWVDGDRVQHGLLRLTTD